MLTQYRITAKGKIKASTFARDAQADGVIWLDAHSPTDEELAALNRVAGIEVPNRHDMTEIELSSRLYKEGECHVMIASLLPKSASEVLPPRPAAFILKRSIIITIRYCDFFSFERVAASFAFGNGRHTPAAVFCDILEEAIGDRADDLEFSMHHLEDITSRLFRHRNADLAKNDQDSRDLADALRRIGGMGERVANIRESIASIQRLLNYAKTYIPESWLRGQFMIIDSMKNDLTALSDEASFFMNKLSFNLDATLGMINIEETKIIRVLSVVTLLLSPPTLIAGIYGMNFRIMPELDWPFGYWFSLALMASTAIASIWYLKRKMWF